MNVEELQRFCEDADSARAHKLGRPWARNGYVWASNGHILVRAPLIEGVEENPDAPDTEKLLAEKEPPTEWISVPMVDGPKRVDCETCHGTGLHDCSCGTEHDCGNCEGEGTITEWTGTRVGDATFADRYLTLIHGWEIAPNGTQAAWIRSGDVMGLLMPFRKPR